MKQQNNPEFAFNYQSGNLPQPFRPQPNKYIAPSTHRPNYSHLFSSHNHDPSKPETFLGEITIQSPADFPPQFNSRIPSFQPSINFPSSRHQNNIQQRTPEPIPKWNEDKSKNKVTETESFEQNLDSKLKSKDSANAVILGTGTRANFLNQRTRIFAPDSDGNTKTKPEVKNYFVNSDGEVFSTTKDNSDKPSTTIKPTTFSYKYNLDPSSPQKAISFNLPFIPKERQPPKTLDLDSLLEEPISNREHSKDNDEVEVIQEVTVPPDQFYTLPPETETYTESAEKYETTFGEDDTTDYDYETTDHDEEHEGNSKESNENEENNSVHNDYIPDEREPVHNYSHINNKNDSSKSVNNATFDVVTLKSTTKMVKDDNFEKFVDLSVIEEEEATTTTPQDKHLKEKEEVISVVTTKSVINNTIIGTATQSPIATEQMSSPTPEDDNTTDTWIVVASVQTSRSVSGARYLPSEIVTQDERTKLLNENGEERGIPGEVINEKVVETDTENPDKSGALNDSNEKTLFHTSTAKESQTEQPENILVQIPDKSKTSTESLIDKLDRVQSDLSSSLLTGGFNNGGNNITVIKEPVSEKTEEMMDIIVKTTSTTTTTTSKPSLPPVVIRKFSPYARSSTTQRPKKTLNIANIKQDDLTGLLPPGFKPKYQNSRTTTTTTTQSSVDLNQPQGDQPIQNVSQVLTKLLAKSKVQVQDVSAFLPAGYKKPETEENVKSVEDLVGKIKVLDNPALLPPGYKIKSNTTKESANKTIKINKVDSLSGLLPPGYKLPPSENKSNENKGLKISKIDDISALLPPGYKPKVTEKPKEEHSTSPSNSTSKNKKINILDLATPVSDISALLPPGYKPPKESDSSEKTAKSPAKEENTKKDMSKLLSIAKPVDDISALLPPGYKGKYVPNRTTTASPSTKATEKDSEVQSTTEKIQSTTGFKVVFPSRAGIGNRASGKRLTTPKAVNLDGPAPTLPSIQKGWPTR